MASDVQNMDLALAGCDRITWADGEMPVLRAIRERFTRDKPLAGIRIAACLHVTAETANLMRALRDGGAQVALCASNPLSTQDDVAAALVAEWHLPVFARRGEDPRHLLPPHPSGARHKPHLTMDDGADLVSDDPSRPHRPAERRRGRERGDDDGRDPAAQHGQGRGAQVSDRGRERRR